ncbi:MAG: transcriptional repressor [Candidatus Peregrinibacteria bacterium]
MKPVQPLPSALSGIPLFVLEVTENSEEKKYLQSIGVFPGSLITIITNTPNPEAPIVVEVQENHFLVKRDLAKMVLVTPALETPENIFEGNKTKQRAVILEVLTSFSGHFTLAECTKAVQAKDGKIGDITIYRALKTLIEKGIVREIDLPDGSRKMEVLKGHHDHIFCKNCGNILEFYSNEMEDLQKKIAQENGITLLSHTMTLIAADCKECRTRA